MRFIGTICILLCCISTARSQHVVSRQAGLIHYAEGRLLLGDQAFQFDAENLKHLPEGQYLHTAKGKAEVQLGPAASLWMGQDGSLQLTNSSLPDTRLRLTRGSIFVEIIEELENNRIRLLLPGGSLVELKKTGLYRINASPPQVFVFRGKAKIPQDRETATVKENRTALLLDQPVIFRFEKAGSDPLYDWTTRRSNIVYYPVKSARETEKIRRQAIWRLQQQSKWLQDLQDLGNLQ